MGLIDDRNQMFGSENLAGRQLLGHGGQAARTGPWETRNPRKMCICLVNLLRACFRCGANVSPIGCYLAKEILDLLNKIVN